MLLRNIVTILLLTFGVGIVAMCVSAEVTLNQQRAVLPSEAPVDSTWDEKNKALAKIGAQQIRDADERLGVAMYWGAGGLVVGFILGVVVAIRAKPPYVLKRSVEPVSFDGIRAPIPIDSLLSVGRESKVASVIICRRHS